MKDSLRDYMRRYAAEIGLADDLADEAADASGDEGRYTLAFGDIACVLAPETGQDGETDLLAAAHLRTVDWEAADARALRTDLAGFLTWPPTLVAPVPVFNAELDSLGILARRPLRSFSDASFSDWMRGLQWACRPRGGALPEPPARAEGHSAEALKTLFADFGAPLPPGNGFWKLAFADCPVLLSFHPASGRAEARTPVASALWDADSLLAILAANASLRGLSGFVLAGEQLWARTPFHPEGMRATSLANVFQRHMAVCAAAKSLAGCRDANQHADIKEDSDMNHYLRV